MTTIDPRLHRAFRARENGDKNWREEANCVGTDPELFFPVDWRESREQALGICRRCPVTDECLAHALGFSWGAHGIWGGTTERERKDMLPTWNQWTRRVAS